MARPLLCLSFFLEGLFIQKVLIGFVFGGGYDLDSVPHGIVKASVFFVVLFHAE